MDNAYIIIIVIFMFLIVIGIISIGLYNRILFRKKKVDDKLNSIKQMLIERGDIIRRLNTLFSNSSFHEDNIMLELNDLYKIINDNNSDTIGLISSTNKILVKALSLDNIYPELIKNQEYLSLKESFKDNQYKVLYGLETYNDVVEEYNNYRNKKIINIVSRLFKMPDYDSYVKDKDEVSL